MTPHTATTQMTTPGGGTLPGSATATKFQERCFEIVRHNLQTLLGNGGGALRNVVDKDKWY
jgi:hypothetical protein